MAISILYDLTGPGWAECTVEIDAHRANITASYLGDALGDLVRETLKLVKGTNQTSLSFWEEPGEYRWQLTELSNSNLFVQILEFPDLERNHDQEKGTCIFESYCPLRDFAQAVVLASKRVLDQYGIDGYKAKWMEYDFPIKEYDELQNLLAA